MTSTKLKLCLIYFRINEMALRAPLILDVERNNAKLIFLGSPGVQNINPEIVT